MFINKLSRSGPKKRDSHASINGSVGQSFNRQIQTTQFAFNFPSNFPSFKTLIIHEGENFAFPKRQASIFPSLWRPFVTIHTRCPVLISGNLHCQNTRKWNYSAAMNFLMNVLSLFLGTISTLRKRKISTSLVSLYLLLTMHSLHCTISWYLLHSASLQSGRIFANILLTPFAHISTEFNSFSQMLQ